MMENISAFGLESGNVSNMDLYLKLILDGLNCDNLLVATSVANLFFKTLRYFTKMEASPFDYLTPLLI